jgi:hypothetical protein
VFTRLYLVILDYLTMAWQTVKYYNYGLRPLSKFIKTATFRKLICEEDTEENPAIPLLWNRGLIRAEQRRFFFCLFFMSCSIKDKNRATSRKAMVSINLGYGRRRKSKILQCFF